MKRGMIIILVVGIVVIVTTGSFWFFLSSGGEIDTIEGIQNIFEEPTLGNFENSNCEGGYTTFDYPPVNLEKTELAVPLGLMTGGHVTPIDHMYFQDFDNQEVDIEVYSPGDGIITDMEFMFGSYFRGEEEIFWEDYRLVIQHTCTISSIFIHIDVISDKLKAVAPEKGGYGSPRIQVEAGEVLGWYSNNVDYNVVDQDVVLPGLLVAEHYASEDWKIHTPSDQYSYFNEPIRSQLIEKSLRHEPPFSGKFDWDIDGRLQGNWFIEGSKGYDAEVGQQYWDSHLSFSPNYLDYDHYIASIGDFQGEAQQFGIKEHDIMPPDVSISSGLVKYELVTYDFFTDTGESWDRSTLAVIEEVRNYDFVQGVVLVEMIEDRKLRFEVFPGKTKEEVSGFTEDAKLYIR